MNRRGFLAGLVTALAAPAIIRTPGLLMAVRTVPEELEYTTGILTPNMIGASFSSIMRRAFVPLHFVEYHMAHPDLTEIMTKDHDGSFGAVTFDG